MGLVDAVGAVDDEFVGCELFDVGLLPSDVILGVEPFERPTDISVVHAMGTLRSPKIGPPNSLPVSYAKIVGSSAYVSPVYGFR